MPSSMDVVFQPDMIFFLATLTAQIPAVYCYLKIPA